jgi:hypothetical protein
MHPWTRLPALALEMDRDAIAAARVKKNPPLKGVG